ncbi:DUF5615 family PIN-like protein [Aquisphaera insulae]|uniref:DUF5615 family PIN-like protein n=1 Tax=Aquisphaera insulae TaxID=2712864 RepID=UPI0013EC330E|nr:DUF5615 family PIN-like protein [Aquisphaera insulae]
MPLSLYMDVHVPLVISEGLRRRGLDVLTSQEDGTTTEDDEVLLERAVSLGRILFTQDRDFLKIASTWQGQARDFPGIIFSPQKCMSLGVLVVELHMVLTCSDSKELAGLVTFLPL